MTPLALLMRRDVQKIPSKTSLREAAQRMRDKRVGSLIVTDGDHPIGIVSETDFVRKAVADGLSLQETCVESILTKPIITLDLDKTAKDANALMAEKGIRHLAITDKGQIVGVISMRDLVVCFKNRL